VESPWPLEEEKVISTSGHTTERADYLIQTNVAAFILLICTLCLKNPLLGPRGHLLILKTKPIQFSLIVISQ
jgi:hypothetical protein